jgi:hypothetical protein
MVLGLWSRRFKWFASRPLLVLAVLAVGHDGEPEAAACGWEESELEQITTFDSSIGEPADMSLGYDPATLGVGARCEPCEQRALRDDWSGYLAGQVSAADWEPVLLDASVAEITALEASLASGRAPAQLRPIFEIVQRQPKARQRISRALGYVKLAREVESVATLSPPPSPPPAASGTQSLQARLRHASAVAAANKDAFLVQRYGFLRLRVTFYERRWDDVKRMVASMPELKAPSDDIAFRARHYLAGALRRSGDVAGSNLELARIYAGSQVLAGRAASDFHPQEDADWQAALQQAGDTRTRALLWHLVGLQLDGLTAAQQIVKLDPTSNLLALLVVRELAKTEASPNLPDPQKQSLALEKLVVSIAGTPGADRPWLMNLVGGHLAAKRGDVATARRRLGDALAARPGDRKVSAQARASLALALAHQGKTDRKSLAELAETILTQDANFPNFSPVDQEVRASMAAAMARSGRTIDAEFLWPGAGRFPASAWQKPEFLKQMLARTKQTESAFDRFVLRSSHTRGGLELEMGIYLLLHDQFAAAEPWLAGQAASTLQLNANPFVTHIEDCVECDAGSGQSDGKAWTLPALIAELNRLRTRASKTGDDAARASLQLGTALYNLTLMGNARSPASGTHQASYDTSAALHWYQRAYTLARDRELKAKAAFLAAKAERGALIAADFANPRGSSGDLPVPTTWFPRVKTFADTAYHREVLAECGTYRAWFKKQQGG